MTALRKVLVIYKKSALQLAKERKNKRILELIERKDPSVAAYEEAHSMHEYTMDMLKAKLPEFFEKVDFRYRANAERVKNYDLVMTVGGDGTFLWASKFVGAGTPVVGVNSSPESSVGFYTAARIIPFQEMFDLFDALKGYPDSGLPTKVVQRLKIEVNDDVVNDRILNDVLFAAKHPAAMTKYTLKAPVEKRKTQEEEQRSSGIWISAPGGSTGANLSAGGWILPLNDTRGQFVVREPMKNFVWGTEHRLTHGFFSQGQALELVCKTRKAVLACDGTTITIPVTIGDRIRISHSDEPLTILGK